MYTLHLSLCSPNLPGSSPNSGPSASLTKASDDPTTSRSMPFGTQLKSSPATPTASRALPYGMVFVALLAVAACDSPEIPVATATHLRGSAAAPLMQLSSSRTSTNLLPAGLTAGNPSERRRAPSSSTSRTSTNLLLAGLTARNAQERRRAPPAVVYLKNTYKPAPDRVNRRERPGAPSRSLCSCLPQEQVQTCSRPG